MSYCILLISSVSIRFSLTSPLILIVMGCLMYASYRIRLLQEPVLLFGKLFSTNQLCIALNIAGIPILYLFGAGQIMFWVVGKQTICDILVKLAGIFSHLAERL